MVDLMKTLEIVKSWALSAGEIQKMGLSGENLHIDYKSTDYDMVTEVDRACEAYLIQQIRNVFPEHSILAEEGGGENLSSEYCWVIDPVDGTTNYTHGFPFFCVSIALQYLKKSVLGVVYAPLLDEMFWAIEGQGAWLNGKKLKVSAMDNLTHALLVTGFPYDIATDSYNNLSYFNRIAPQVSGVRRTGSAALDECYVAAGRLDGYWEFKLKPWDVAAGDLVVKEAGGQVMELPSPTGLGRIVGNPEICRLILQEIETVGR